MLVALPYAKINDGTVGPRRPPCIPVTLIGPSGRVGPVAALVDSGCTRHSVLHPSIAGQLGLEAIDPPVEQLVAADGPARACDVYQPRQPIVLGFDVFTLTLMPDVSDWAAPPYAVVLGFDFFEQVTVAFDQPGQTMWFGFPGVSDIPPIPPYEEMIACRTQ